MRTARGLFARLVDPGHLSRACDLTVRGKRRRPEVAWFLFRREAELDQLAADIRSASYRPASFELLTIRDPKPRLICRAPIRDRTLETALVLLMQPIFERSLAPDAYACRPGHGNHRAVLRLQALWRRHRFALHLDIRSYFPSIDRERLFGLIRRRIRDAPFLHLVRGQLDRGSGLYDQTGPRQMAKLGPDWPPAGRGLPIGSSLSQLCAAFIYLADGDHFVKRQLRVPGYLRYVDDLFLFADRRRELEAWRGELADWLERERGLRLKHPAAPILDSRGTLDALGYRLTRQGISPRPRTFRRLQRQLRGALLASSRDFDPERLRRSLAARSGALLF